MQKAIQAKSWQAPTTLCHNIQNWHNELSNNHEYLLDQEFTGPQFYGVVSKTLE